MPFIWGQQHDRAFNLRKKVLTQPPVLKFYEPKKELVIQCDASELVLGASLMQEGKPLAFASRALTLVERNYAQIEKELLAIVFAAEHFHQYTFGRPVSVDSDQKPLEMIFAKPLVSAPVRLQKMLMSLQLYDLSIRYKKGTELHLADTLSRHYLEESRERDNTRLQVKSIQSVFDREMEDATVMHDLNFLLATEDQVTVYRDATDQDETLQQLKRLEQAGWPGDRRTLPVTHFPYFHIRDELVVEDGLTFRGNRLVIPQSRRRRVTDQLHASHQGVASTLRTARELVFCPNMSAELKDHISISDTCCALGPKQPKQTFVCH